MSPAYTAERPVAMPPGSHVAYKSVTVRSLVTLHCRCVFLLLTINERMHRPSNGIGAFLLLIGYKTLQKGMRMDSTW